MKTLAPLAILLLVVGCPKEEAPAPVTPPAPQDFSAAATAYCKHERPLVISDPIQSKNLEAAEAKSGQASPIRDEAKWIPVCLQRQQTLVTKYDEEKVMKYFACAMTHDSLVSIRTKCFRSIFPPAKVNKDG